MQAGHAWNAVLSAPASGPSNPSISSPSHSPPEQGNSSAPEGTPRMTAAKPVMQSSCQFCRKRKIKCDKLLPTCSHCMRVKTECTYPASQRRGRPRYPAKKPPPSYTPAQREEFLLKKVKRLEGIVRSLRGVSTGVEETASSDPVVQKLGKLVGGKPYVNDNFWTSGELANLLDDDNQSVSGDDLSSTTTENMTPHLRFENLSFIFPGINRKMEDLRYIHPPSAQIPHFWRVYCNNCESIMRLLHEPTAAVLVEAAQNSLSSLSPPAEVLLFSIYFAAVTSLGEEDALSTFGADKQKLLTRFENGIQKGIRKVAMAQMQDIRGLQAFVLYLSCIRHSEGTAVWTLAGLCIRLAQNLGLDKEATLHDLSPLDAELRRRLWFQIMLVDTRASEARGFLPTLLQYSTKLPVNINESDLSRDSKELPHPRAALTDMSVALLRYELFEVGKRLSGTAGQELSLQQKERVVEELERTMHLRFYQYFDSPNVTPLALYARTASKMIISRMFLMLHQRGEQDMSHETRDRLFFHAINVVEKSNAQKTDPFQRNFEWLFRHTAQWHATALILKELMIRPSAFETTRAWNAIELSKDDWDQESEADSPLSRPVRELYAQVKAHRATLARHDGFASQASSSTNTEIETPGSTQLFLNLLHPGFVEPVPGPYMASQPPMQQPFSMSYVPPDVDNMGMPLEYAPTAPQVQIAPWIFEPPSFTEHDMMGMSNPPNFATDASWGAWGDPGAYRYAG